MLNTQSAELVNQGLRCFTLSGITIAQDFFKDIACAAGIAHFLVRLGQIEFRRNLLPMLVFGS